jgi:hypothetical protein
MAMFDWFEPNPAPTCPVCGNTPSDWQGQDGPSVLLVWSQGHASPTEHKVDAELQNHDVLRDARLPDTFSFAGWDANDHRLEIAGSTLGGVWTDRVSSV